MAMNCIGHLFSNIGANAAPDRHSKIAKHDNGSSFFAGHPLSSSQLSINEKPAVCPFAPPTERSLILQHNKIITPTGCTAQFCSSGKMVREKEPKLGESRTYSVIKQEAAAFLTELRAEGVVYPSQPEFDLRLARVMREIDQNAVESDNVWADGERLPGSVQTSTWRQTSQELEHGIRLAWKNSRKCIMRSHYRELKLCDFRHVTTSKGMVTSVLDAIVDAYNDGKIKPTAFVFPPRGIRGPGPMFWNKQILSFAAYEMPDGTVMGDPANLELTKDIIDLGWVPPEARSQWDLLPVVAMAEGDAPCMAEIPPQIASLVSIRHPTYKAIDDLNLKWVRFPALSSLGFDIGGVQYTAAPFIGWFMEAEISLRNLGDTFRYNCLPRVAQAVGFDIETYRAMSEFQGVETFEDLPDYEQLLWLSRAQNELNYAVRWSFGQAGVSCIGTLAASNEWCKFDDDHFAKHGYRLPSDPYWIMAPQGSIVPVWHRGGAPNYQPKPMIERLKFDPVKSWHRRRDNKMIGKPLRAWKEGTKWRSEVLKPGRQPSLHSQVTRGILNPSIIEQKSKVHIFYASTGTTATKLSERLRKKISQSGRSGQYDTLNTLDFKSLAPDDTILLIVATTGNGDFPSNGVAFEETFDVLRKKYATAKLELSYAIFGVGDSGYPTFNSAAVRLDQLFKDIGGKALVPLVKSDVMVEALPLGSLNSWWAAIEATQDGSTAIPSLPNAGPEQAHVNHSAVVRAFAEASHIPDAKSSSESRDGQILKVRFDVAGGRSDYTPMSHLRLLPRNSTAKVDRLLRAVGRENKRKAPFRFGGSDSMCLEDFLRDVVDLEAPFTSRKWLSTITPPGLNLVDKAMPILEVVEKFPQLRRANDGLLRDLCLDMPLLRPRTFSVASAPNFSPDDGAKGTVELLVRVHPQGRVSDTYLSELQPSDIIKYSFIDKVPGVDLLTVTNRPIIAITTGTGFAPLRSLIQHRIVLSRAAQAVGQPLPFAQSPISLFVGFKSADWDLITDTLDEGIDMQLFDAVQLVQSNPQKRRVQDHLAEHGGFTPQRIEESYVYVCGARDVVRQVHTTLSGILKGDVRSRLGTRYIEEIF